MRTFENNCAQGDVFFRRINSLPDGVSEVKFKTGPVIVTHSETGHHHVMDRETTTMYRLPESVYDCFLVVKETTSLEHRRSNDTHEAIQFNPGIYHVRRQREYTPEGFRRVED